MALRASAARSKASTAGRALDEQYGSSPALGRRIGETCNGASVEFSYDEDNLVAERRGDDLFRTVHADGLNTPVARLGGSSAYYILQDKQGSVRALVDASGAVRERYSYTAYGETTIEPASEQPPTGNRLAFQGHIYEPATGLYSMRARSYAPKLGRFLSPDPIGVRGGANLYAFASNRPGDVWDPFGLTPQSTPSSDRMPDGLVPPEPCVGPYCESRSSWAGALEQHAYEAEWGVPESAGWRNAPNSSYDVLAFEPDSLNYANVPQGLRALTGQEGSGMAGAMRLQNDYANLTVDTAEAALDVAMLGVDVATAGASPTGDLVVAKWFERAERLDLFAPTTRGAAVANHAIIPYYPANNGFFGATSETVLQTGQVIDRVGGSAVSRFFSPVGTPLAARALPPGTTGSLRAFEVLKPFSVESGTVAPAFGELGFGTQFRSPMTLGELLDQGFVRELKP